MQRHLEGGQSVCAGKPQLGSGCESILGSRPGDGKRSSRRNGYSGLEKAAKHRTAQEETDLAAAIPSAHPHPQLMGCCSSV